MYNFRKPRYWYTWLKMVCRVLGATGGPALFSWMGSVSQPLYETISVQRGCLNLKALGKLKWFDMLSAGTGFGGSCIGMFVLSMAAGEIPAGTGVHVRPCRAWRKHRNVSMTGF